MAKDCFIKVLLLATCFTVAYGLVPSFIKICQRNDPKLSECIINSIYDLLPRLRVGIEEFGIPPIEPFTLSDVQLNTGTDAARVYANLTNIKAFNGSNFKLLELIPNVAKNRFQFKVRMPKIRLEGNYKVDTKVLFLEVMGNGPFHVNVTDYYFDCILKGNKVKRNGNEHLHFEKMKCVISYGGGELHLSNLFGGNPVIEKATNDVINDNLDLFFVALKPNLIDAITTTFTNIANKITYNFEYNEFFP